MQSLTAQVQALTLSKAKSGAIIEHHQTQVLELREEVKAMSIAAAMATGREADLTRQIVELRAQFASSTSVEVGPALSPAEPIALIQDVSMTPWGLRYPERAVARQNAKHSTARGSRAFAAGLVGVVRESGPSSAMSRG